MSYKQMKTLEAEGRMAALRKVLRNPSAGAGLQHRSSLVGNGAKWRITNLNQVARAIAKWAQALGLSLHHFSEVLKIRDEEGRPCVLIGGQAVNYWAERYASAEPRLEKLRPFRAWTSISRAVGVMSNASRAC